MKHYGVSRISMAEPRAGSSTFFFISEALKSLKILTTIFFRQSRRRFIHTAFQNNEKTRSKNGDQVMFRFVRQVPARQRSTRHYTTYLQSKYNRFIKVFDNTIVRKSRSIPNSCQALNDTYRHR